MPISFTQQQQAVLPAGKQAQKCATPKISSSSSSTASTTKNGPPPLQSSTQQQQTHWLRAYSMQGRTRMHFQTRFTYHPFRHTYAHLLHWGLLRALATLKRISLVFCKRVVIISWRKNLEHATNLFFHHPFLTTSAIKRFISQLREILGRHSILMRMKSFWPTSFVFLRSVPPSSRVSMMKNQFNQFYDSSPKSILWFLSDAKVHFVVDN